MRSVFLKSFLVNGFFIKLGRLEESVDWEEWGRKLNSLGLVSLYKKTKTDRFGPDTIWFTTSLPQYDKRSYATG